jgi:hypothetical protein
MGADVVINRTRDDTNCIKTTLKDAKFKVIFDVANSTSWWNTKGLLETNGACVATLPSVKFLRDVCLSVISSHGGKFVVACKPIQKDFELVRE